MNKNKHKFTVEKINSAVKIFKSITKQDVETITGI